MGLDMYLTAKMYLSNDEKQKEVKEKIAYFFKDTDLLKDPCEIEFSIHYWRKANAIHNWFVKNVQGGVDDCGTYQVSWEQLEDLLNTIKKVLGSDVKEQLANEISQKYNTEYLPTTSGFFFGNTEYDEYYIQDLKDTKEMLEKVLAYKGKILLNFHYSSSW